MYSFDFAFVYFILTAASAVPLRFFFLVIGLTVEYFADGRGGVNGFLLRKWWVMVGEQYSSRGSYALKRGRSVSIKYETAGTGDDLSGEDFQNTGTLIVVKSSVFPVSSVQTTHLARDANYAYSRKTGHCQVLFFQSKTGKNSFDTSFGNYCRL